jgi:hypothetical protein
MPVIFHSSTMATTSMYVLIETGLPAVELMLVVILKLLLGVSVMDIVLENTQEVQLPLQPQHQQQHQQQ